MNLLHANDQRGEYPESWYAATAAPLPPFDPLRGDARADVAIIGGGFTGLSAALHLAEKGYDVALIEAHRVGFGASGRNGGQASIGQRQDQDVLEKLHGKDDARKLWDLALASVDLVKTLIARHGIDAAWRDGVAHAVWSEKAVAEEHAYIERIARDYDYHKAEPLDRAGIHALIGSEAFYGGFIDWSSGHLHPLRYAFGLARAATAAGARIFETTEAHHVETRTQPLVRTGQGRIKADHVLFACNGYLGRLNRATATRVMPINNFILATEPLGDRASEILAKDIAVADSKFVVNYWRLSEDKRLLFGGGESYGDRFPRDIAAVVRKPMLDIYPQLADARIDYAWGGTLAITPSRMPYFARLDGPLWTASGYSGHGVALATLAGHLIAEAIDGTTAGFDLMSKVRPPAFPGLGLVRRPLLSLAMRWFALRDRLGI